MERERDLDRENFLKSRRLLRKDRKEKEKREREKEQMRDEDGEDKKVVEEPLEIPAGVFIDKMEGATLEEEIDLAMMDYVES